MNNAVANLLLRITGETRDARGEVRDLGRALKDFDDTEAVAEVDVETKKAAAELDSFRRNLARLSKEVADPSVELDTGQARSNIMLMLAELNKLDLTTADPKVNANVARAMAELGVLSAMIDRIDNEEITIDVEVRKDLVSRMNQVVGAVGSVTKAVGQMGDVMGGGAGGGGGAAGQAFKLTSNLGPFGLTGSAAFAGAGLLALAAIIGGALLAGLLAVISAAAGAATALAALGVAAMGAFLPIGGFLGILVWRISDLIKKGGQLGQEFQRAGQQTADVFQRTVSPAVRGVIRAITAELRNIRPLIEQLREPLVDLGRHFTNAFKGAADELKRIWPDVLELIRQAGPVIELLIPIVMNLLNIFLQIALLAMPYLLEALRKVKSITDDWVSALEDMDSGSLATIVGWLRSFYNLGVAVKDVILGFIKAAGPAGQQLVDWLAQAAAKMAEWLNSTEGQETMRQFFTDILPLIQQTLEFVGRLIILFFQIVQAVAPALAAVLGFFNTILGVVTTILSAIMGPLQWLIETMVKFIGLMTFGLVYAILGVISQFVNLGQIGAAIWDWIKQAAEDVWNWLKQAATDAVQWLGNAWNSIKSGAIAAWNAMKAGATASWNAIKSIVTGAINVVKSVITSGLNAARAAVTAAWNAMRSAASAAWGAIRGAVSSGVNAVKSVITSGLNAVKSFVGRVWDAIKTAASTAWNAIKGVVQRGLEAIKQAVMSFVGAMREAGKALMQGLANGIKDAAMLPFNAAKDAASAIPKAIGGALGIGSPSKVTHKQGEETMQGLANGIRAGAPKMITALTEVLRRFDNVLQRIGEATTKAGRRVKEEIENMAHYVTNLQGFATAVMNLGDSIESAAEQAMKAWADAREEIALAAIDDSPLGQELKALLGANEDEAFGLDVTHSEEKIGDLRKQLEALNAELNDPGRTRSRAAIESEIVNTQRALRDEEAALAKKHRDDRIAEIQEILEAQRDAVTQRAELERAGRTEEARAYRDSLQDQLDAQRAMLAQGEISWATFVRRVKKILGPLGIDLEVSNQDEVALRAGRSFINSFVDGMKQMSGRAKKWLKDLLQELKDLLPGSEPKDSSSPLRGLGDAGKAAMENFARGMTNNGQLALKAMQAELSPMAHVAHNVGVVPIQAQAVDQGPSVVIEKLERNFNLPPGPGGGYEPMYAAAQLDQLMQNEGRL